MRAPIVMLVLAAGGLAAAQDQPAASPGDGECLKCHDSIGIALKRNVKHAAVEMGCETCHVNHRASPKPQAKAEPQLNAPLAELCGNCHDVEDQATAKAHQGQPFQQAECTGCHDPHASDQPKLMPARAHAPFEARQCEACHQPPQAGKVRLAAAGAAELCFTCHAEMKDRLAAAKSRHTLLAMNQDACTECHNPHASNHPRALKKSMPALCNACHAEVAEGKKYVHKPVQVSCALCHDPHAASEPKNLRASGNTLCLECHGGGAARLVNGEGGVALFNGSLKLETKPFEQLSLVTLAADGRRGHPFANHPVSAPAHDGKAEISCLTCHRAHAGNGGRHRFVTDNPKDGVLCVRCH